VEAVNAAPEFMAGRRLVGTGRPVAPDILADPARPLQDAAAG
jgi:3-phenylpropionate/trans-cinnamate dioxygenase ferredoxin reductase subunit